MAKKLCGQTFHITLLQYCIKNFIQISLFELQSQNQLAKSTRSSRFSTVQVKKCATISQEFLTLQFYGILVQMDASNVYQVVHKGGVLSMETVAQ